MGLPQPPEPPEQRHPPLGEPRRQQPAKDDDWAPVAGRPGFFRDRLGRLKYRPPGF